MVQPLWGCGKSQICSWLGRSVSCLGTPFAEWIWNRDSFVWLSSLTCRIWYQIHVELELENWLVLEKTPYIWCERVSKIILLKLYPKNWFPHISINKLHLIRTQLKCVFVRVLLSPSVPLKLSGAITVHDLSNLGEKLKCHQAIIVLCLLWC